MVLAFKLPLCVIVYVRLGLSGTVVGAVSGLVRSSTPALFAAASGVQWFALGGTFWATRGLILHAWEVEKVTARDRVYASGIAGGFAGGSVGLLMRGKMNVLPGTLMFSIFGLLGQSVYNRLDAQQLDLQDGNSTSDANKGSFLKRVANSRWSPMKVLTDEEYEAMLQEKLLRVNTDIALIDERIVSLKDGKSSNPRI